MSIIEPLSAFGGSREPRSRGGRGTRGSIVGSIVAAILSAIGWGIALDVGFDAVDDLRLQALGARGDLDVPQLLIAAAIAVSTTMAVGVVRAFTGAGASLLSAAGGLAGIAIVASMRHGRWSAAPSATPDAGLEDAGSPIAWMEAIGSAFVTTIPDWLPVASGAAAAVMLVAGLVAHARATTSAAEEARLQRVGVRTRGHVVESEFTSSWVDGMPVFDVLVEFSTTAGSRRHRGSLQVEPACAPMAGGTVEVLYDRDDPDDTGIVRLSADPRRQPHPHPEDFVEPVSG